MWWHTWGLAGPRGIDVMHLISAIFVAVCMVPLGAVLFLGRKGDARTPAIMALAELTCIAPFNAVGSRLRDRSELGDQISDLSRGTTDLARQVAEISSRLGAMEERVGKTVDRARGAIDLLATEIGELAAAGAG
jgi:cyclic-di-GMP phosphodiesterase TipF (flagellum assembly factor)